MKTALSAPSPDKGHGASENDSSVPAAITTGNDLKAKAMGGDPRYNQGARYGTPGLRYYVGVETPPEPSAILAKVKLEMSTRTDGDLGGWVGNHINLITGNASFPGAQPLPADLAAALEDFEARIAAQIEALAAAKAATTAKDMSRKTLEDLMTGRGAWVQMVSGGNAALIESVGLGVKNPRTPVGQLHAPLDFRIDLNGSKGVMRFKWSPVFRSRGYIIQCSPDVHPRQFSSFMSTTKASAEKEMDVGETYVFRVAAFGGSTGQSYWSPEVIRGAA